MKFVHAQDLVFVNDLVDHLREIGASHRIEEWEVFAGVSHFFHERLAGDHEHQGRLLLRSSRAKDGHVLQVQGDNTGRAQVEARCAREDREIAHRFTHAGNERGDDLAPAFGLGVAVLGLHFLTGCNRSEVGERGHRIALRHFGLVVHLGLEKCVHQIPVERGRHDAQAQRGHGVVNELAMPRLVAIRLGLLHLVGLVDVRKVDDSAHERGHALEGLAFALGGCHQGGQEVLEKFASTRQRLALGQRRVHWVDTVALAVLEPLVNGLMAHVLWQ